MRRQSNPEPRPALAGSVLLIFGNAALCAWCGAGSTAPLVTAAEAYLAVRALGCPINAAMLVMQASFRGTGDAQTPLRAAVLASVSNLVLDPIAIFTLGLGLQGAALATVASQVLILALK